MITLLDVADPTRVKSRSPRGATSHPRPVGRVDAAARASAEPSGSARATGAVRPLAVASRAAIGAGRPGDVHGRARQRIATGTFVPRQTVKGVVEPDTATAQVADHHTISRGSRKQAARGSSARVLQSLALVTHERRTRREATP
jgi:hypothetical protein